MTSKQLESVVAEVKQVFGSWGPDTSIETIRKDWDALFSKVKPVVGARAEKVDAGGVKAEWISAPKTRPGRVIVYLHGGGYVLGSVDSHRDVCERLSRAAEAQVLALDYRLAPEHPFPAAIEDVVAAYRWLLAQGIAPKNIAFSGDSAGGGLTFSSLVSLRDSGDPLPACAATMSPWVDVECIGESMTTRDALDPMVHKPMTVVMSSLYHPPGDYRNPLVSPLYADLAGLPPVMIHVGSNETLHDDSTRIAERAKAAGVPVQLKVWEGQVHVFQIFASRVDEGEASIQELGAFIRGHIG